MSEKKVMKNLLDGISTLFDLYGTMNSYQPKYKSRRMGFHDKIHPGSHYTPPICDKMNLVLDGYSTMWDLEEAKKAEQIKSNICSSNLKNKRK